MFECIKINLDQVTQVPDNIFFNDRWQNSQSDRSVGQPNLISEWKIIKALIGFQQSVRLLLDLQKQLAVELLKYWMHYYSFVHEFRILKNTLCYTSLFKPIICRQPSNLSSDRYVRGIYLFTSSASWLMQPWKTLWGIWYIWTVPRLALLCTEQQKHQSSVTPGLSSSPPPFSFIPMATTRLLILITTS